VSAPAGVCGPETRIVCEWVYQRTGGDVVLAAAADWLVGRPLAVVGVLVAGWVLRRLIRRVVSRAVGRFLAQVPPAEPTDPARAVLAGDTSGAPRDDARRTARAGAVSVAVSGALSALVWVVVLIAVSGIVGLDLGPVIASAGLAGVALAFGAQSLIKDLLNGVLILVEDHFGIGDEVDLGEAVGVVERISLRETVLRDLDGTVWHVPNGEIERVGNLSQVWSAALIDVAVAHGTDLRVAQDVLREVATAVSSAGPFADEVLEPPELLGVQALTAEGVVLRMRVKTLAGHQSTLERALLEAVLAGFVARGVEPASPQLTLRVQR
jgi:small conductance mechanosensitive channel